MWTQHAHDRLLHRLPAMPGLDPERVYSQLMGVCAMCKPRESVAVKVLTLDAVYFDRYTRSNGDTLIAIIRDRRITTLFLRRSYQPFNATSLNVDRVLEL